MTRGVGGSTAEVELARIVSRREIVAPIAAAERQARIAAAQERMREIDVAALWLDASSDLDYFTGVRHGQSERLIGAVLPQEGALVYLSPAFEAPKLRSMLSVPGEVLAWQEDEDPCALLIAALRDRQIARGVIALDEQTRFVVAEGVRAAAQATGDYRLTTAAAVSGWLRARKSPAEIALLRHAMRVTLQIQAAAARILHEGIATTEVEAFLRAAHRKAGFDPGGFAIALFGEATAYPHGLPHPQTLRAGDMVLVDCGAPMHGYMSDITRSYVFGQPSSRQRAIWAIERRAQQAGFAAVRPGAPCGGVDDAARGVIVAAGFGPGYATPGLPHRTGHGIGLDIHEGPYLVKGNAAPLAIGMTGSIEPTLCLYGEFGVRLEDHFVVTPDGAAWLTPPSPDIDDPFGTCA